MSKLKLKDDDIESYGKAPFTADEVNEFGPDPSDVYTRFLIRGSHSIREKVASISDELAKEIPYLDCSLIYKKHRNATDIFFNKVDSKFFVLLASLKSSGVFKKPIDPLVFAVMKYADAIESGTKRFFSAHACACRMVDNRYHYLRFKIDDFCRDQLALRGWIKDAKKDIGKSDSDS